MPTVTPIPTNFNLPEIKPVAFEPKKTFWQKLGNGISSIWRGVTSVFTATGTELDANGNKIIVRNSQTGEVVTEKNTSFNWGALVAGIGSIVGVFRGTTYTDPVTGRTYEQDGTFQNQNQYEANKRTGRAIIIILISGIVIILLAIFIPKRLKKK